MTTRLQQTSTPAGRTRPTDPNAPCPNRALLHLTMKPTAQLPATLEGEKHFIGLTDDADTLAANTLAAGMDTWDDAVGHPAEHKDRIEEREDTRALELMDHLVQLTSPQNITYKEFC